MGRSTNQVILFTISEVYFNNNKDKKNQRIGNNGEKRVEYQTSEENYNIVLALTMRFPQNPGKHK